MVVDIDAGVIAAGTIAGVAVVLLLEERAECTIGVIDGGVVRPLTSLLEGGISAVGSTVFLYIVRKSEWK